MESQIRNVRRLLFVVTLLPCILLHAQTVWGDYLLTLRSGLQIRAQTYRIDGSTIHVETESGSITLPLDIVVQITEKQFSPAPSLQPSTEQNPDKIQSEQTYETHPERERHSPLYIPDEKKSP